MTSSYSAMTKHYRLDRKSRAKLAEIDKPEYYELARYNAEKHRGVRHDPEFVERMARVQKDYNETYVPARTAIESAGRLRRVWW